MVVAVMVMKGLEVEEAQWEDYSALTKSWPSRRTSTVCPELDSRAGGCIAGIFPLLQLAES